MQLSRRSSPKALISLVPMIDVMLILLVFFMVTSTYLNLDMIPALRPSSEGAETSRPPTMRLMIRIGADGTPNLRGQALSHEELGQVFQTTLRTDAQTQLVILPSGSAPTQALISVMDQAALSGMNNMRVLRLEARP